MSRLKQNFPLLPNWNLMPLQQVTECKDIKRLVLVALDQQVILLQNDPRSIDHELVSCNLFVAAMRRHFLLL